MHGSSIRRLARLGLGAFVVGAAACMGTIQQEQHPDGKDKEPRPDEEPFFEPYTPVPGATGGDRDIPWQEGPGEEPLGENLIEIDGVAATYGVVYRESRLVVRVRKKDRTTCDLFHNHAIEAPIYEYGFELRESDLESSFFDIRLRAEDLDPDADDIRALYPETKSEKLGNLQRETIYLNTLSMLNAKRHPVLHLRGSAPTTVLGGGEISLEVDMAGKTSTTTMNFEATTDGDRIIVTGSAVIAGGKHGLPSGPGSNCVRPAMPLDLSLVLLRR